MDAGVPQSGIPQVYDSLSKTYDIWGKLEQNGFQVATREYHQQLLFPSEVILALKK